MAGMNWRNPFTAAERNAATPPNQQSRDGTVRTDDATYFPPNRDTNNNNNNRQPQNKQQNRSMSVPDQTRQQNRQSNNQQDTQASGTGNEDDDSDDPMFNFAGLWENPVNEKGEPINQEDNSPKTFMPAVDPQKFGQMLEKLDFTRSITPDEEAAIVAGGPESVKALRGILNKTSRQSFATMFNAFTKMTESGFNNASNRFMSEVPNHVREMLTDNALEGSNPLLKLPAFAPMVKGIRSQYQKKFPKASSQEITTAVNAYFDKMYQDLEASKRGGGKGSKKDNLSNDELVSKGDPNADFEAWLLDEGPSQQQ